LESKELHKTGCITAFGGYIKQHAVSLGGVGIGLAVVQFVGIFFACYISKQIREKQWLQA
jgi:CD63 antigen